MTRTLGKDLLGLESLTGDQIRLILDTAEPFKEISERAIKKVPGASRLDDRQSLLRELDTNPDLLRVRREATVRGYGQRFGFRFQRFQRRDARRYRPKSRSDANRHGSDPALRVGRGALPRQRIESNVINAGDGTHEHPTQGLLDILTLRDRFGDLKGRRVCICGDILHSRVARSNIWGLTKLGAEVAVCGPRSLLPNAIDEFGVRIFDRVEEAIEWAEALNVLRLQFERMTAGYIPSAREYNRVFGITRERLDRAPRDILILHPGPMNRGVEIDSDVADGPHSVILDQVTNGVAVRMAVLYLLAGGKPELAEAAKGGSGRGRDAGERE